MTEIRPGNQASHNTTGPSSDASPSQPRPLALIPAASIAGRALVAVIAIMTFLATLTAGAALLIRDSSQSWSNQITREMTIQIKPQTGRDMEKDLQTAAAIAEAYPAVESVRIFSKQESLNLLEPWLGSGVSIDDLPVPRLIIVKPASRRPDIEALKTKLREAVPQASLDDHRIWFERLTSMANALVFAALIVLILVMTAMAFAITFATRGAMAGTKDIIDVLHFVGAHDRFISKEFQKHFFKLGLKGSAIGGLATFLTFLFSGILLQSWNSGPGSDQIESLFGSFTLGWHGFAIIACVTVLIAILVGYISRLVVFRHLQSLRQ